jgi:hypothetical protein
MIDVVVRSGRATLNELKTSLGLEDLHDLYDLAIVEAFNRRLVQKWYEDNAPKGAR